MTWLYVMDPYSNMTSMLMRRENLDIDLPVGRPPCEDEDRDRGDASSNVKGCQKLPANDQKLREEPCNRFSLMTLKRNALISDFQPPEPQGNKFVV